MKPGQSTSTRPTPERARATSVGSVYGFSHSARAEPALEGDGDEILAHLQPLGEQARGLQALAVVRIAERRANAAAGHGN